MTASTATLTAIAEYAAEAIGNTADSEGDAYQQGVRDLARRLAGLPDESDTRGLGTLDSALEGLDCDLAAPAVPTILTPTARQIVTAVRDIWDDGNLRDLDFYSGPAFDSAADEIIGALSDEGAFGDDVFVSFVPVDDPNEWGAVVVVRLAGDLRVASTVLGAKDLLDDRDDQGLRLLLDLVRNVADAARSAVAPLAALSAA